MPSDLVTTKQVAEMLGLSRQRVQQLSYEPQRDFPKPSHRLPLGVLWRRRDIERWDRVNNMRDGRGRRRVRR